MAKEKKKKGPKVSKRSDGGVKDKFNQTPTGKRRAKKGGRGAGGGHDPK